MAEEISDNLFDIAQMIVDLADDHQSEIEKTEVPYAEIRVEEFSYDALLEYLSKQASDEEVSFDEEPSAVFSHEEITEEEWNTQDKYQYITQSVEESEAYNEISSIIDDRFSEDKQDIREEQTMDEPDPNLLLYNFINHIADQCLEGDGVSEKEVVNLISSFTSEIERPPIEWRPTIYINGIGLESDSIDITESISLRRSRPDDINQEIRMDSPWYTMNTRPIHANIPSAVIEYEIRAKNRFELFEYIEELVSGFRLFKVGSIINIGYDQNPTSLLRTGGQTWDQERTDPPYIYVLEESDGPQLNEFFNNIFPKFQESIQSVEEENYLTIAYDRYENALLDESSSESRLVSTIMALEAIYLSEKEEGELSERLAQRTGLILSLYGNAPIKVYRQVKRAYNIRSNYVHGSKIDEESRKGLSELEERIADYARKSIVVQLQVRDNWNKSDFLSKIDNSILDSGAREEFKEEMVDHCDYWHAQPSE